MGQPVDGMFDVVVHGSPEAFHVLHNGTWVELSHRSLAQFISKSGYVGGEIRLISCSSGACSTGVAQNLANKMGTRVIAPNGTLWLHPNGNMTIGPGPWRDVGEWITFVPGGP